MPVTSPSLHGGVALAAQHVTDGRRDLAGREDPGRHLVEQRREQVMVGLVDERDRRRRAPAAPWPRTGPPKPEPTMTTRGAPAGRPPMAALELISLETLSRSAVDGRPRGLRPARGE